MGLRHAVSGIVVWVSLSSAVWAQSSADLRQQGLALRQSGDVTGAIAAFEQAVQLEPENVGGRVLLGWTQHLAGADDQATQTLLGSFYLDPLSVETLNALGIVYLVKGELLEATVAHTWAAMLRSDNEIAYYNLSLTHQQLGNYDWAIATGTQAAELEPTNPHPFVALAIAHWSNGQPDLAAQAYEGALALDGRYGDRAFLNYLDEAAFSPQQIQLAGDVLSALGN